MKTKAPPTIWSAISMRAGRSSKKLKQNDELGWRFVDNEEQAVHGVETGGY